jgi:hypothetical protein
MARTAPIDHPPATVDPDPLPALGYDRSPNAMLQPESCDFLFVRSKHVVSFRFVHDLDSRNMIALGKFAHWNFVPRGHHAVGIHVRPEIYTAQWLPGCGFVWPTSDAFTAPLPVVSPKSAPIFTLHCPSWRDLLPRSG